MVSNPTGKTGRRGVHYVAPGDTKVIYEDRVLDVRFKESPMEFAKKINQANVRNNNMAYVDDATAKKYADKYYDYVEKQRSKGAKAGAKTRKANVTARRKVLKDAGVKIPRKATDKAINDLFNTYSKSGSADANARAKALAGAKKKKTTKTTKKTVRTSPMTPDEIIEANRQKKANQITAKQTSKRGPKSKADVAKERYEANLQFLQDNGYPRADPRGRPFAKPGARGWQADAKFVAEAVDILTNRKSGYYVLRSNGGIMIIGQ